MDANVWRLFNQRQHSDPHEVGEGGIRAELHLTALMCTKRRLSSYQLC